jgi:hypothetical protein
MLCLVQSKPSLPFRLRASGFAGRSLAFLRLSGRRHKSSIDLKNFGHYKVRDT